MVSFEKDFAGNFSNHTLCYVCSVTCVQFSSAVQRHLFQEYQFILMSSVSHSISPLPLAGYFIPICIEAPSTNIFRHRQQKKFETTVDIQISQVIKMCIFEAKLRRRKSSSLYSSLSYRNIRRVEKLLRNRGRMFVQRNQKGNKDKSCREREQSGEEARAAEIKMKKELRLIEMCQEWELRRQKRRLDRIKWIEERKKQKQPIWQRVGRLRVEYSEETHEIGNEQAASSQPVTKTLKMINAGDKRQQTVEDTSSSHTTLTTACYQNAGHHDKAGACNDVVFIKVERPSRRLQRPQSTNTCNTSGAPTNLGPSFGPVGNIVFLLIYVFIDLFTNRSTAGNSVHCNKFAYTISIDVYLGRILQFNSLI